MTREVIAIAAELWSPVRVYDTQQAGVNAVTSNERVRAALGRRNRSIKIKKNCNIRRHGRRKPRDNVAVSPDHLAQRAAPCVAHNALALVRAPARGERAQRHATQGAGRAHQVLGEQSPLPNGHRPFARVSASHA
jgi:hypothetical protein